MPANETISKDFLYQEASELLSVDGENTEYDRAICELLYWVTNNPDGPSEIKRQLLAIREGRQPKPE